MSSTSPPDVSSTKRGELIRAPFSHSHPQNPTEPTGITDAERRAVVQRIQTLILSDFREYLLDAVHLTMSTPTGQVTRLSPELTLFANRLGDSIVPCIQNTGVLPAAVTVDALAIIYQLVELFEKEEEERGAVERRLVARGNKWWRRW